MREQAHPGIMRDEIATPVRVYGLIAAAIVVAVIAMILSFSAIDLSAAMPS